MKKFISSLCAAVFILAAFAVLGNAEVYTCGAPGTEGMQPCNTTSKPNEKCCIKPSYKGVKTVVKSGNKAIAAHSTQNNSQLQNQAVSVQHAPAVTAPAPTATASSVVSKVQSAQAASPQMSSASSTPATPATPAAAASASSGKAAKAAKASK